MRLLAERTRPPLRARIVECDCDLDGCQSVFVLAQTVGAHEELWLGMGVVLDGFDAAAEKMDELLDSPDVEVGFRTLRQMVERGVALVGMTWGQLSDRSVLEAQIGAWVRLPEWMERLPAGQVWATRGVVFGRDLTRVVRALWATDYYYVPDSWIPEQFGGLEQPYWWGVQHPEAPAPPERWYAVPPDA